MSLLNSIERESINQFYEKVREALLLKRELFEGKLKVIEKDAEVQATFSDYAPQLKLGTTNNYSLYKEGTNTRMSSNDYMDLYLKVDYPFLDYGRREINTQISIFQWQYQYKDLAIKVNETAFDLVKIYLEYNSLRRKNWYLKHSQRILMVMSLMLRIDFWGCFCAFRSDHDRASKDTT